MRHRIGIGGITGLGNPAPELMESKATGDKVRDSLIRRCAKDAYEVFFKGTKLDYNYCDAAVKHEEVRLGIEPAYQYQELKMIVVSPTKENSYIRTGIAFGYYGSGIRSRKKFYSEFKYKGKFVRFVDKWHNKLFKNDVPPS